MAKVDLRKVKDEATRAVENKQYAKAAELYLRIASEEPAEPDWRQRAGEALRKVPDAPRAIEQLTLAAEGYAQAGFLLKAIAVCKVVLQLDGKHTATQARLADLYARRDGRPAGAPPPRVWQPPARPPARPSPRPAAPAASTIDRIELGDVAEARIAPGPTELPLDALPLHELIGSHQSATLPVLAAAPVAYEIELDETDWAALMAEPAPPPLPKIPLFSSLGPAELRYVIERSLLRELEPGEIILRQGEPGASLFVVVRGRVEVTLDGPAPRKLATLGEGAFFGELAILTDSPRSATVTAVEPTQLIEISRAVVTEIAARSPEVLKVLMRFFRDRLLDRFLGTAPLFSSFAPDEARALAERFVFLELAPGTCLIGEGERAPGLFLLLAGEARVRRGGAEVARLGPGDVCGEMSLLERASASATIETVSKCWALELPRERFQEIMVTYPQILEYVSTVAEQRKQANLHVDFI
jgi:CRP-like cAMP-binding protein